MRLRRVWLAGHHALHMQHIRLSGPPLRPLPPVPPHRVFGWTKKNEISNGRWVMMGIGIGLLTEYATGVSFIDQLRLMASYMGLVDLDY